jgi:peroxiredoxin
MNIGDTAPDFILKDQDEKDFKLSDFRNKCVLLSFHPLAFTGYCTKQMLSLESNFDTLTALNIVPVGISVDPQPSKKAWADSMNLKKLRILSDFWPHGKVSQQYGLFRDKYGTSQRANVIVDETGKIIFLKVYPILSVPDIMELQTFIKIRLS